nr:PREDICTED: uncharacterized protein LOC109035668 [Bemisia tabaci]
MLPIFDGNSYTNWKKRILKFLEFKKCKVTVERKKKKDDKQEDWENMDIKATNFIYSAISDRQLEYVSNLESAYEIMQKFDEMYLKESTALQIVCRSNLENLKLKDKTDPTKFFDEFEKCVNELKNAGAMVSEDEKLNYMLKALPPSLSHIGDLMDVLPKAERTVDYLKSKLKLKTKVEHYSDDAENQFGENGSAFAAGVASHKTVTCCNCGKLGHYQAECVNEMQHVTCHSCGNYGHYQQRIIVSIEVVVVMLQEEVIEEINEQRGNPRGNHRGNNRGYHRGNFRRSH